MTPSQIISGKCIAFDQGIASHCGIPAAIIYNHITYWLDANFGKSESMHEGKVWMYQTQQKMAEYFKFFDTREIKYSLKKLIDCGLLIKKNFSKNPFDHTNWYSLPDESYQKMFAIVQKCTDRSDKNVLIEEDKFVPSDGTNLYPSIKDKKKEKKENTIPTASPVVVSSHLSKLEIPDSLKAQLTSDHDEAYLKLLVKRYHNWKSKEDPVSAIKTIQNKWDDWHDFISKDDQTEKNKAYLESLKHLDNTTWSHNKITIGSKYIEFGFGNNCKLFEVDNPDFIENVQKYLKNLKDIDV